MFRAIAWRALVTLLLGSAPVVLASPPLPAGAVERLGTTHFRVESEVWSAAASTDGTIVAIRNRRGVYVINAATSWKQRFISEPFFASNDPHIPAVLSPDGRTLGVVDPKEGLILHDTLIDQTRGPFAIGLYGDRDAGIAFSANGARVAASGKNDKGQSVVRIWDRITDRLIQEVKPSHDQFVQPAFSADGCLLVAWSENCVETFDVDSGKRCSSIQLDGGRDVVIVALSPNGKQLAVAETAADKDWPVAVYDPRKGKRLARYTLANRVVAPLKYTPDAKWLVAAMENGGLQIWDAQTGESRKYRKLSDWKLKDIVFQPNGRMLGFSSCDQAVCLWDVETEQPLTPQYGHTVPVCRLSFSRDSSTLFTTAADGVHEWDAAGGKHRRLWLRDEPTVNDERFELSPDATRLLRREINSFRRQVVDLARNRVVTTIPCTDGSAVFSADGTRAAFAYPIYTRGSGSRLEVWDLQTGRRLFEQDGSQSENSVQALSADGRLLAMASPDLDSDYPEFKSLVRVWSLTDGKQLYRFPVVRWSKSKVLAFSSDGSRLATVGPTSVDVWDVATGEKCFSWFVLLHEDDIGETSHLAFSANGRMLAAAVEHNGEDDKIVVWEMATAALRSEFKDFGHKVTALAFSPDCRTLASAHEDTTILLWDSFGPAEERPVAHTWLKPPELVPPQVLILG